MKSPSIVYLITRVHGLRQHLLKPEDYARLVRARNIVEMSDILMKTDYSPELSKVPIRELRAEQLERIFHQKLSDRLAFLLQVVSGKVREALEQCYRRIEVENIKRIIRAVHGKEKIMEDQLIPFPRRYQSVNVSAMTESRTVQETMSLLKETLYRTVAAKIDLYGKYKTPLVLEAELDKAYCADLWGKLGRITDKARVKDLIGTEIDLENLLYVFSFKHMDIEPELLQQTIIDIHHKLPKSLIPRLAEASLTNIPKLLTWPPYAEVAAEAAEFIEKGMLAEAEHAFSQHLYSYTETQMLRNPNSLVFVFGYLNLCFKEARNLIALAYGKQLELEDERIQKLLFL